MTLSLVVPHSFSSSRDPLAGSVAGPHGLERVRAEVQLGAGPRQTEPQKLFYGHNHNLDIHCAVTRHG
jgi:hypothetical protein